MSATTLQLAAVEPLAAALREDKLGDFSAVSPVAACLMPLLEALRWRGSDPATFDSARQSGDRIITAGEAVQPESRDG